MSMGKRRRLEKDLRQSRRRFPFEVGFAAVVWLVVWVLHELVGLPLWIAGLFVGLASFGAVGDGMNIIYCRRGIRRLRGLEHDSD
jgi:hypothetical protein